MSEDTGLDVSHEVYGGREGQTACWGKNYVVSGQQLWHVEANYGVSGNNYGVSRQITACRGKLRRVGAHYVVSGQQLRRVEANYVVSRQFTSCRGKLRHVRDKLRRVKANYVVSGQITTCRGNLRRVEANYGVIHAHKLLMTVVAPCIHDYVGIYWKNEEKSTPLFS